MPKRTGPPSRSPHVSDEDVDNLFPPDDPPRGAFDLSMASGAARRPALPAGAPAPDAMAALLQIVNRVMEMNERLVNILVQTRAPVPPAAPAPEPARAETPRRPLSISPALHVDPPLKAEKVNLDFLAIVHGIAERLNMEDVPTGILIAELVKDPRYQGWKALPELVNARAIERLLRPFNFRSYRVGRKGENQKAYGRKAIAAAFDKFSGESDGGR